MDELLRIAVVGALGKGKAHAKALQGLRGATLSAVVDRAPEANQVAVELDVPERWCDPRVERGNFIGPGMVAIRSDNSTLDVELCPLSRPVVAGADRR